MNLLLVPYNVIGAIVIPGLAFGALLLMPFLDTSQKDVHLNVLYQLVFMLLSTCCNDFLTWESVANHDWEKAKA